MNLETIKKRYYTQESIVDLLTKYELYYQISLGSFVLETLQDIDETLNKLNELNLQVDPNTVLSNIFEIILHQSHENDFENKFEYYLRKRAIMHSLKDFVNNDKELVNATDYIEQKTEDIKNDKFFTDQMKLQLESEYSNVFDYYDLLISDETVAQIHGNLQEI